MANENPNLMEVDFQRYCEVCKYRKLPENDEPCNTCLETPVRESTRKPECFEEK